MDLKIKSTYNRRKFRNRKRNSKRINRPGVKDIAVIGRKKTSLENLKTEFENINFLTLQGIFRKPKI